MASTTSTAPTCAPTIKEVEKGRNQVDNGSFETGNAPWARSSTNAQISRIVSKSYEGCAAFVFQPSANTGNTMTRSANLTSNSGITPASTHDLTFYLGRKSTASSSSSVAVTAAVRPQAGTAWTQSFTACNLVGANGSVWKKYTANNVKFNSGAPLPLMFTVTWSGATTTDSTDDVLIDGVMVI
ncbi:hypothetical protein BDV95DRAFT_602550 [Massariosphaeria phaeospora]|uniref:CBM-cenC domain-containing protein n=1 Tax=Massariosphaeria phaeospora TaxID=100035 RepID=A0A7C8IGG3_9PLEO|nr:hypothetical protein BDV95DRAFT_602550 [Massariosphaeria phaeospora]